MNDLKQQIEQAIKGFATGKPLDRGRKLLNVLGYKSDTTEAIAPNNWAGFKAQFVDGSRPFIEGNARVTEWQSVDLIFQLGEEDLKHKVTGGRFDNKAIYSYVFFCISLTGESYSRTDLARITREVNKLFDMPAMIMYRYGDYLTIAAIDRRLHKRDETKDVLEKVTFIKDIQLANPHRAHIEILHDLSLFSLSQKQKIDTFVALHNAWRAVLDTNALNKRFYREIADWYFWAVKEVQFPLPPTNKLAADPTNNSICVIRLLTRLIFTWFLKEKGLVPDYLFDEKELAKILESPPVPPLSKGGELKSPCIKGDLGGFASTYYRAILQNLFFATLNAEMNRDVPGNRRFVKEESGSTAKQQPEYGIKNIFRYAALFAISKEEAVKLFDDIPFLNGGLFDCLDKEDDNGKVIYLDGFTRNPKLQPVVPDYLFFSDFQTIDLSDDYGDKKRAQEKVRGLIRILRDYKFTVAENTPIEEEVALDPELLGNVFENLLASYNPETGVTARKQTGSFYTPRMIVNYMVDESLKAYLEGKLESNVGANGVRPPLVGNSDNVENNNSGGDADKGECHSPLQEKLSSLIAWNDLPNPFSTEETGVLIEAIHSLKTLDPAVGSGAFPMGLLHKMTHILHKLDPDNARWKQVQLEPVNRIPDPTIRNEAIAHIEDVFDPASNQADYGRKLYLIQNCIYGVDIQPIAVQIAKLRFFISLVVDQKVNDNKKNRGVLALPNLETRFVAANTLMGIDKPVIDDLFGGDIRRKEVELKQVRSRHFDARTRADKLKCMANDKRIRGEIAGLLEKDNYPHEKAVRLSGWNPYDQNTSADFFDAEWMFGILDGFDICIGNPPYGRLLSQDSEFAVSIRWPEFRSTKDVYIAFILAGTSLNKKSGILTFIVPTAWLGGPSYKSFRATLLTKTVEEVVVLPFDMFAAAYVDTLILRVKNSSPPKNFFSRSFVYPKKNAIVEFKPGPWEIIPQEEWRNIPENKFILTESGMAMAHSLRNNCKRNINDLVEMKRGVLFDSNCLTVNKTNSQSHPYFEGDVYRYQLNQVVNHWVEFGPKMKEYPKEFRWFEGTRLLLRRLVNRQKRLMATFTDCTFITNKNLYSLIQKPDAEPLKVTLALINSRLISHLYIEAVSQASKDDFPQVTITDFLALPVPTQIPENDKSHLSHIVDKILAAKKNVEDTSGFEAEIDRLVYQLYGLTDDEIAVVEGKP